jgi:integral membrane protein (TIGR01906 family)
LLLLSAAIAIAINCPPLYSYGFEKYDVSQSTGLDSEQLEIAVEGLRQYFNSDEEFISITVIKDGTSFTIFNEKEVIHLKDVKDLFHLDYQLLGISLLYALGYASLSLLVCKERRQLAEATLWGAGLTLGLMLILGIGALFDFNDLFWQFHVISFSNDFWLLDPNTDYLVMLFPNGFWYDATIFITVLTATTAIITGGSGLYYIRKSKYKAGGQSQ